MVMIFKNICFPYKSIPGCSIYNYYNTPSDSHLPYLVPLILHRIALILHHITYILSHSNSLSVSLFNEFRVWKVRES